MKYFDYDYYHGNLSEIEERLRREKYINELENLKNQMNFAENIFSNICFGDSNVVVKKEKGNLILSIEQGDNQDGYQLIIVKLVNGFINLNKKKYKTLDAELFKEDYFFVLQMLDTSYNEIVIKFERIESIFIQEIEVKSF